MEQYFMDKEGDLELQLAVGVELQLVNEEENMELEVAWMTNWELDGSNALYYNYYNCRI